MNAGGSSYKVFGKPESENFQHASDLIIRFSNAAQYKTMRNVLSG